MVIICSIAITVFPGYKIAKRKQEIKLFALLL